MFLNSSFSVALWWLSFVIVAITECTIASPPWQRIKRRKSEENALEWELGPEDGLVTPVKFGINLPESVGYWEGCGWGENGFAACWGDYAILGLWSNPALPNQCYDIAWSWYYTDYVHEIEDCFDLHPDIHWYGGGETRTQTWPIESVAREEAAYVNGDWAVESIYGGVVENYFLLSNGVAIYVDPKTPFFFSLNSTRHPRKACFKAKRNTPPFQGESIDDEMMLHYTICQGEDMKEAHQIAMSALIDKPTGIPDEGMLLKPFWSTWAEFKTDVNQSVVLDYARRIVSEGFTNSSHLELDDNWETCYGEATFDPVKFPNPKEMVQEIREIGMGRTTAWMHPFINYECDLFNDAVANKRLVMDKKPRFGVTGWWRGENAGLVDMTNPEAVAWYIERLEKLRETSGLDSFKFDAGEVIWLPAAYNLNNDTDRTLWPSLYTTMYVDAVSHFGGLVETRVAHRNQKLPNFVRMLDKDSRWGYDNGLASVIPTLLYLGIAGYPFVLPDMIGGNAAGEEKASKELFIRWMQLNTFMPAVQFSLAPWKYDQETVDICLQMLSLREKYSNVILDAARQATVDGSPINRPLWWVDPTDVQTFRIDDEYMVGDSILVAPVTKEGSTSRHIYLPRGTWVDREGNTYQGQRWIFDYSAPLHVLPYFVKQ